MGVSNDMTFSLIKASVPTNLERSPFHAITFITHIYTLLPFSETQTVLEFRDVFLSCTVAVGEGNAKK